MMPAQYIFKKLKQRHILEIGLNGHWRISDALKISDKDARPYW